MRLTQEERDFFKSSISNFSNEAKVYLFGSRVDDDKKGGDIDLLIVSKEMTKQQVREVKIAFYKHFGEQKLDVILDDGQFKQPFTKLIAKRSIAL